MKSPRRLILQSAWCAALYLLLALLAGADALTVQVGVLAVGLLAAALTPIAIALGTRAAALLKARTGIDLTTEAALVADHAVGYAEQLAVKFLRDSGLRMPAPDMYRAAAAQWLEHADAKGWPAWLRDQVTMHVEAAVRRAKLAGPTTVSVKSVAVEGGDVGGVGGVGAALTAALKPPAAPK